MTNPSNYGNTAGSSAPPWWLRTEVVPAGATGATGATGPAGAAGATGAIGPTGPAGLLSASAIISAAAMRALHSAPPLIVPAQGAGKIIDVLWAAMAYGDGIEFGLAASADISYLAYGNSASNKAAFFAGTVNASPMNNRNSVLMRPGGTLVSNASAATLLIADLANQPILLTASADAGIWGAITGIAVTSGQGGAGYAPGDLFGIDPFQNASSGDAVGRILTVGGGGAALTVSISGGGANAGTSYNTSGGVQTQVNTGGGDGNLQVDLTVATPQNGPAWIKVWYDVITPVFA